LLFVYFNSQPTIRITCCFNVTLKNRTVTDDGWLNYIYIWGDNSGLEGVTQLYYVNRWMHEFFVLLIFSSLFYIIDSVDSILWTFDHFVKGKMYTMNQLPIITIIIIEKKGKNLFI